MVRFPDPKDLDYIVDRSAMAPEDAKDWSRSSVPGGWWCPTRIGVADGKLRWDPAVGPSHRVEPTPGLLREFITIAGIETPKQRNTVILRFAQKWGPLHLCYRHTRPVWHQQVISEASPGGLAPAICPPVQLEDGRYGESLWTWYLYALLARDVVHAGALLRSGRAKPTSRAEATTLRMLMVKPEHQTLVAEVQRLMHDGGGFAVFPDWASDQESLPVWRAEVRTLAAALGVALWNALQGSPGVTVCTKCGTLFSIRQRNQRYCDRAECQKARKRIEKARLRAQQASAAQPPEYSI
jgi:hypothetical protein